MHLSWQSANVTPHSRSLLLARRMIASSMKASHIIAVLNICKRGDVVFLNKLLASDCNFREVVDRKGRNALHYCAETDSALLGQAKPGGRLACAELLLESKFDLQDQADNDGFLPFHHAVIHGNIPLVKVLLAHGGDVNCAVRPSEVSNSLVVAGRTAFHLAVIYSNYEMLEFLLSGSFELNNVLYQFQVDVQQQDAQHAIALHYAIQLPEAVAASMIKCIVEKSQIRIDSPDAHRRTPLHWAATIGAAHAASILIELGADMTLVDESGLTALHCAASRGHSGTVDAIIKHLTKKEVEEETTSEEAEETAEGETGEDQKRAIEQNNHVSTLRTRVLNAMDADGCTPLFYSVTMGHSNVTRRLLVAGANACKRDNRGRGLLHCVSRSMVSGSAAVVPLLVAHGVDPEWVNMMGESALHEASSNMNRECVVELLKLAPVRQPSVLNAKDASQHTPLQLATIAALKTNERPAACATAVEICRELFAAGALAKDVEEEDNGHASSSSSPLDLVHNCLQSTPNYRPALELEKLFSGKREEAGQEAKEVTGTSVGEAQEHSSSDEGRITDDTDQDIDTTDFETEVEQEEVEAPHGAERSPSSSSSLTSVNADHSKKSDEEISSPRTITPFDQSVPFGLSSEGSQEGLPSRDKEDEEEEEEEKEEKAEEEEKEKTKDDDAQQVEKSASIGSQQAVLPSNVEDPGEGDASKENLEVQEQNIIPVKDSAKGSRRQSAQSNSTAGRRRSSVKSRTSEKSFSRPTSELRRISAPPQSMATARPPIFHRQASCSEIGAFSPSSRPSRTGSQARQSTVSIPSARTTSTVSHSTIGEPPFVLRRSMTDVALQTTPSSASSSVSTTTAAAKSTVWTQTSLKWGRPRASDADSLYSSRTFVSSTGTEFSQRRQPQPPYRKRPLSVCRGGMVGGRDAFRRNSRGIYESPLTARQRMPLPTITPYLTPVARWPREMASMMLLGEVTPLYCTGRHPVPGAVTPRKPVIGPARGTGRFAERARSAIEARLQLTVAETQFVSLAARVLQQYDTLSHEREALRVTGPQKPAIEYPRSSQGKRTVDGTPRMRKFSQLQKQSQRMDPAKYSDSTH